MKRGKGYRSLWVFDFDGTLSPIVPVRSDARLHPASRMMLGRLAREPEAVVAVLSSRALSDLVPRVPVPRVYLGGGSGLEWRLPGGYRIRPGREIETAVDKTRGFLAPTLASIAAVPGVDLEDKGWSIAVHYRRAAQEALATLAPLLEEIRGTEGIRAFDGPMVMEIQLVAGMDKGSGLERLCRYLRFDPHGGRVFYAGDDENDGTAMRWVIARKGTAISVGNCPGIPGARVVGCPASLARAVRFLAGISRNIGGNGGG